MVPHPAHHTGPTWCSPFPSKPSPHHPNHSGMGVHHAPSAPSHSSPHIFTFPPTPPKDATPDNVSSGHSQSTSTASVSAASSNNDFGSTSNAVCSSSERSLEIAVSFKSHYADSSHHNMISTWGSNLANSATCNKPREGTANFSSLNQSIHHPTSINPYHPAHYPTGSCPPSSAELTGSASYGFSHHPHSTSSMFNNSKSLHNAHSAISKSRSKGRSSAGKRHMFGRRPDLDSHFNSELTLL
ncbi:GATA-binding factor 2-like protein [Dinothrombium tinctorium]|uniref:GATA-binding factor 2-like protein n=1 Tax=Dinothrombium tinctorium TaxID=1965070 RepID=A0A443RHV8_9ACAR|nr:GATA-binding factor 2-like protein [Dinothrombium tinctorium]